MSWATEAATSAWFSLFHLRRAGDVAGDSPVAVSALRWRVGDGLQVDVF